MISAKAQKIVKLLGKFIGVLCFGISIIFFCRFELPLGLIFLILSLLAYGGLEEKYIRYIDRLLPLSMWCLSITLIILGVFFAIVKEWKFATIAFFSGLLILPPLKIHSLIKFAVVTIIGVVAFLLLD